MAAIVDLDVEEREGVPIVRLGGEIDMSVTADVAEHLASLPPEGAPGLVVDMTELEYLDSAGLRLLLQLSKRVAGREQSLRLVVAGGSLVANLLEMTRVDDLIPVDATVDASLAALATGPGRSGAGV